MNSARVRETLLAHCTYRRLETMTATTSPGGAVVAGPDAAGAAIVDQPCWVVSLSNKGHFSSGPPGAPRQQFTYVIALVDPMTGEFLRGLEGAGPE